MSASVCAAVNAVTMETICRGVPPRSRRPTRKIRWSGPIRMCSMPSGSIVRTSANVPWLVPAVVVQRGPARVEDRLRQRAPSYRLTNVWCWGSYGNISALIVSVADGAGERVADRQLQRVTAGEHLEVGPLRRQRDAVGFHGQASGEQRRDGRRPCCAATLGSSSRSAGSTFRSCPRSKMCATSEPSMAPCAILRSRNVNGAG